MSSRPARSGTKARLVVVRPEFQNKTTYNVYYILSINIINVIYRYSF